MSKRKNASADGMHFQEHIDDRADYIRIGTEFPSDRQQRALERRQNRTWDGKHKDYSRDAFKGGFTAGYHNTVGSKEGWQPAAGFTSSRSNRPEFRQMQPEDFMDEEDLADIRKTQKFAVSMSFANPAADISVGQDELVGLDGRASSAGIVGSIAQRVSAEFNALGLLASKNRGIGDAMLGLMGWKPGQGIGPLSRAVHGLHGLSDKDHVARLPPRPTFPVSYKGPKQDKHGVGYGVDSSMMQPDTDLADGSDSIALPALGTLFKPRGVSSAKPKSASKKRPGKKLDSKTLRLSFGTFDDDDDDDEYGGYEDKSSEYPSNGGIIGKKRSRDAGETQLGKLARVKANPAASKESPLSKTSTGLPFCFDGKLPLPGFLLLRSQDKSLIPVYSGPHVPDTFTGVHDQRQQQPKLEKQSRWDVAQPSERTDGASKMPQFSSEKSYSVYVDGNVENGGYGKKQAPLAIDPKTAKAALSGYIPFGDNAEKHKLYRRYLETCADAALDDARRELLIGRLVSPRDAADFAHMARLYQPNTAMLSRFKSVASDRSTATGNDNDDGLAVKDEECRKSKVKQIIRRVQVWAPSQILCKRMGLVPPANAIKANNIHGKRQAVSEEGAGAFGSYRRKRASDFIEWNLQRPDVAKGQDGPEGPGFLLPADWVELEEKVQETSSKQARPERGLFESIFGQE